MNGLILLSLLSQPLQAKEQDIRIGICGGNEDCILALQLEYGNSNFATGVYSNLLYYGAHAHYNVVKTNDNLRFQLGVRGQYEFAMNIIAGSDSSDQLYFTPYLGAEFHTKRLTIRATGGVQLCGTCGDLWPTASGNVSLMYNFNLAK